MMNNVARSEDAGQGLDALAFLLASDQLSTAEKIARLEQWRYDMLLLEIGATEGFGVEAVQPGILEQISKVLLHLERGQRGH